MAAQQWLTSKAPTSPGAITAPCGTRKSTLRALKGIFELFDIAKRHWMSFYSVSLRPFVFRQIISSEHPVQQRKMDRKIHINRLLLDAMMPVMKARRHQKLL